MLVKHSTAKLYLQPSDFISVFNFKLSFVVSSCPMNHISLTHLVQAGERYRKAPNGTENKRKASVLLTVSKMVLPGGPGGR